MAKANLTTERLRELLDYDPETGGFTRIRKLSGSGGANAGNGSFNKASGYRMIHVDRRSYFEHRLAWFYVHGTWPTQVFHVNGDRVDNRISNLTDVPPDRPRETPSELTAEKIRELFNYDPDTGVLRWRNGRQVRGVQLRSDGKPYLVVHVFRRLYRAHRVVWAHYHGAWPTGVIDHINGDGVDNRIENLRDTDMAVNSQNQRRARIDNKSGFLGVETTVAGTYQARIRTGRSRLSLGTYATPEEAHQAYLTAKRRLHEGCTI